VGAGAGATVGKLAGLKSAMKGGVGTASIRKERGLVVAALVAVNAVGDVVDPATGEIVAGARSAEGGFLDARKLLRSDAVAGGRLGENTTIGVVATNASLTKAQATKVARMAQDGLARTLYPSHTPLDGDTIFVLATGASTEEPDVTAVGALAADVVAEAILRAVREAEGIPAFPSVRDLAAKGR
jgi:L-aminopeptidase/D-esterase-like protein